MWIRDIKEISDGTTKWRNDLSGNLQIFPILILGKPTYSTMGFNYIMNKWFNEELVKETINCRIRIRPLIVIDMDTLILLEDSLACKRLKLEKEIEYYFNFINKKAPYYHKYLSFSDYIISQRERYIFSESSRAFFNNILKASLLE